eukprot:Colp12_sorted_trinity150504_noHs@19460
MGSYPSLEILDLSMNSITSIPPNFAYLATLRALYLSDNELEELPTSISRLTSLEVLALRDNKLKSLPKEIGELQHLKELLLQGNQLRIFPPEMGKLDLGDESKVFKVLGNPLIDRITEPLSKSVKALFDHLKTDSYAYFYTEWMKNPPPLPANDKDGKDK